MLGRGARNGAPNGSRHVDSDCNHRDGYHRACARPLRSVGSLIEVEVFFSLEASRPRFSNSRTAAARVAIRLANLKSSTCAVTSCVMSSCSLLVRPGIRALGSLALLTLDRDDGHQMSLIHLGWQAFAD